MARNFKVEEDNLIHLEQRLNQFKLDGMALGGLLAGTLLIELLNGSRDWSMMLRFQDLAASFNIKYRSKRAYFQSKGCKIALTELGGDRGLLTFISARPHLFNINKEIWNCDDSNPNGFIFKPGLKSKFQEEEARRLFGPNDLLPLSFTEWRSSYNTVEKELRKTLNVFCRDNALPGFVARRLENRIMEQSQALLAFKNTLEVLKPSYLVVEHDRYSLTSPMVIAAKRLGIPSYTMMHGAVNFQFGYLPLLADYLLCWGPRQKSLLESYIGSSDRILISGAPQLSNMQKGDRSTLRSKLSLGRNEHLVILGTNPLTMDLRTKLINLFGASLESNSEFKGLVRLHPSESKTDYLELIEANPHLIFDDGTLLSFEESLSVADLVCIYNSAYGLDAIVKGKPLCILNVSEDHLGQGKDFIEYGSFPEIKRNSDFKLFLKRWLNDSAFQEEVRSYTVKYAAEYCANFGEDAAAKSLAVIRKTLKIK